LADYFAEDIFSECTDFDIVINKDIIIAFPIISKLVAIMPNIKDKTFGAVEMLIICRDFIKKKDKNITNAAIKSVTLSTLF
jgi:uncharacterized protein YaiI (UPF0178 family)